MTNRTIFGVAAIAVLLGSPALAADMPVKAQPVAPVQYYDWSGFYFGVNVGGVRQHETWTYANPAPNTPPTNSSHPIDQDTGVFGGHVGAQYQFHQVVVGAEAALSGPMQDRWGQSSVQCVATVGSLCEAKAGNLLTVGGRLGWAWDRWLVFATGGWASLELSSRELTAPPLVFDTTTARRQKGSYFGGGVEYALADHVILGLEYQHVQVGSAYQPSSADAFGPSPPGVNGRNIDGREDIIRARLSLKFGVPGIVGTK
jgi:outer membrane immunogenic protein